MTIEFTLTRIADALEALVELNAGRNLLLEGQAAAAEEAGGAIEKAATRGRRSRKAAEQAPEPEKAEATPEKAEPAPEPEKDAPAAEKEPEVEKPAPAAEKAPEPTKKDEAVTKSVNVNQVQARAVALSKSIGKEKVLPLIQQLNPEGKNISTMNQTQLNGLWAALDALELGAAEGSEFN